PSRRLSVSPGMESTEIRSYFPLVILKYCEADLGSRDFKGLSWKSLKDLQALKLQCLWKGFFFWRVCFRGSPEGWSNCCGAALMPRVKCSVAERSVERLQASGASDFEKGGEREMGCLSSG